MGWKRQHWRAGCLALLVALPACTDRVVDMMGQDAGEDLTVPDWRPIKPDLRHDLPGRPGLEHWPGPVDFWSNVCSRLSVGKPCTKTNGICGFGHICLLTSSDGSRGVCTCECSADNPQTSLVNEDTCPGASTDGYSRCGAVMLSTGKTMSLCFHPCAPKLGASDCNAPLVCEPGSGAVVDLPGKSACLYSGGCEKDADCGVTTGKPCHTPNPSLKCTGAGETCIALNAFTDHGWCTKPGKCDIKSRLCGVHALGKKTAKVGDPCKSSLDCGGNMRCLMEFDSTKFLRSAGSSCAFGQECCSGYCRGGTCDEGAACSLRNRNGYCTITGCTYAKTLTPFACPAGSVCNNMFEGGGACQKTCDLTKASQCRGYKLDKLGDYECWALSNISYNGLPAASKPVCGPGYSVACDSLKAPGKDCSAVGLSSNTTQMFCRDLKGNKLAAQYDPKGMCLDNTASGPATP